ncbi:TetR/AcrR family transcriptional regulator [Pseudonocardia alni]|uniref:TetR/AcrR family transcriptional regulator n=1 Tax=Pseudonocardia alni TaxID=33907 RepID=UPI00280B6187|nr:TetR/AcrR family transcriptional regulator [Pseudonocardia alni]
MANSRPLILEAAARIARSAGTQAVTLEAVAVEAGVSKSGVIHHFRGKATLLDELTQFLIERWEAVLVGALETDPGESTLSHRLRTYIQVTTDPAHGPDMADLALLVEGVHEPSLSQHWRDLQQRWLGPAPLNPRQQAAVLGAHGLWLAAACRQDIPHRTAVVATLLDLIKEET